MHLTEKQVAFALCVHRAPVVRVTWKPSRHEIFVVPAASVHCGYKAGKVRFRACRIPGIVTDTQAVVVLNSHQERVARGHVPGSSVHP